MKKLVALFSLAVFFVSCSDPKVQEDIKILKEDLAKTKEDIAKLRDDHEKLVKDAASAEVKKEDNMEGSKMD